MQTSQESTGSKIGQYTKYQREKRGWTLNEFAQRSDLTASFLLRLESGEYQTVKFDVLQKIAMGLDMPVRNFLWKCDLIEGDDPDDLPTLSFYLKEKFQMPEAAIGDIQLFLDFVHKKYKTEIAEMKKAHQTYWKKKK